MNRGERGRFAPGPMPAAHKRRVSRGARARARALRAQQAQQPEPDKKRCNDPDHPGERWLSADRFRLMRHKLKSGGYGLYRASKCLECESRRAIERKRRWREKMGEEEVKRRNRKASKKYHAANREARNEANRMTRIARGQTGRTRRPEVVDESRVLVDGAPLIRWLDERPHAVMTDSEARRVRGIRAGTSKRIDIATADRILTRAGEHDQVAVLWPGERR